MDTVVSYLSNSQDLKILQLGFMLLDNVIRAAFKYKVVRSAFAGGDPFNLLCLEAGRCVVR